MMPKFSPSPVEYENTMNFNKLYSQKYTKADRFNIVSSLIAQHNSEIK